MNWHINHLLTSKKPKERIKETIDILLQNRGLQTDQEKDFFLHPPAPTLKNLPPLLPDLDLKQLKAATKLIKTSIKENRPILIFGDYDCDGVAATAILYQALHSLGAKVWPFIPDRHDHGYGLSVKGVKAALKKINNNYSSEKKPLVITVDNGVSALPAAQFLDEKKIPLIITDHHHLPTPLPPAKSIVHTTGLSGSGIAWLLASSLTGHPEPLDLAALGTVCDLLPLTGANRMIVTHGLKDLQNTSNLGLQSLYQLTNINPANIEAYHLGFTIGPRINAAGRLGSAIDALRLLCTTNSHRASQIAQELGSINSQRQDLTKKYSEQAISLLKSQPQLPPLIFLSNPEYPEGIIGLIASQVSNFFHRPTIICTINKDIIKASARSIKGIHITDLISTAKQYLDTFGGHEQAAGFTSTISNLEFIQNTLLDAAQDLNPSLFQRQLNIEVELTPVDLSFELLDSINSLAPFGMGNSKPIFTTSIPIDQATLIGQSKDHLKIKLQKPHEHLDIIGFGLGYKHPDITPSSNLNLAFSLQRNTFNGNTKLQLNLKDLQTV